MQAGWSADLRKGCTKEGNGHYPEQVQKGLCEAHCMHSHSYCIGESKYDSSGTAKLQTQAVQDKEVGTT